MPCQHALHRPSGINMQDSPEYREGAVWALYGEACPSLSLNVALPPARCSSEDNARSISCHNLICINEYELMTALLTLITLHSGQQYKAV